MSSLLGRIDVWGLLKPILESDLGVIVIALGGFILAKKGFLSRESQKAISNLNVYFFTPCLVFEKVGNGLNLKMLIDLSLLPVFYVIITAVSIIVSYAMARIFRLSRRQRNFATACITFQNSNSLPLALVTSLANTVENLKWDKIPDDTAEKVASRGIMYLLIFSQLGQALRWSYGYRILLSPIQPDDSEDHDRVRVHGNPSEEEIESLLTPNEREDISQLDLPSSSGLSHPGGISPTNNKNNYSENAVTQETTQGIEFKNSKLKKAIILLLDFFSPPLYSLFIALFIAVVPPLQRFFFEEGSFVEASITSGIRMVGDVAVPLILVVLGASLATDIGKTEGPEQPGKVNDKRVLIVSLLGRMVVVPMVILPAFSLLSYFSEISTVDDPVFVVVIFLLVGSPTAIQLTQICQLNGVFERECAKVLWWSYAIFTPPNSLLLAFASLLVVDWTK
ncbi:auxin family transmembrane transporter [Schizosaccharomyces cryophilus OY26]|uniref:Auxin family transmembrane transporter n=1 Tax=Schizosaccharomyces cryophilus (strain OY26 / ATCC MYA-4695 / CBS 11777 / NBRC 106824 / NRRL Y48691) TaxID=653667 RepID=S9VYU0_SCHCR|nr:auxin family transmembrane transporter [Schizosaccharomyces cryophilus OY26]EPY50985.1 auxin family transmembrane transporter [Schizosaccharomyces cryophilus OY26]